MAVRSGSQGSTGATMERQHAARDVVEAEASRLVIRLLGGFAILRHGVPLPGPWRTEKARALVKLLALAPGHALHRDQVLEWLWPEQDPAAAANNLYFALHAARRALAGVAENAATDLVLR